MSYQYENSYTYIPTINNRKRKVNIQKIAAFSDNGQGGNPAGVLVSNKMPSTTVMQEIAAEVGFSETVFAEMIGDERQWRVRYFSPESEVAFCGHATIALGAALAKEYGDERYLLKLNDSDISVEGERVGDGYQAALQSPLTRHTLLTEEQITKALTLFGYERTQLSNEIAPARIHAGAEHYVFVLKSTADLSAMQYNLDYGRDFMRKHGLVTVMFVVSKAENTFHARNAFASGGVLEAPATGAAAAAFTGYLRDSGNANADNITIIQGEDMGARSVITAARWLS